MEYFLTSVSWVGLMFEKISSIKGLLVPGVLPLVPFIAGELSLADLYLAPIIFYVSLTPDKDALFDVDGFADWWARIQALPSFKDTQPDLG